MKKVDILPDDICTLYIIGNKKNTKFYVGQTWKSIEERFREHKNNKNGNCRKLFNAFNKHGRNSFYIVAVAQTKCQECADQLEIDLIKEYKTLNQDYGYNINEGGSYGKHSEETKLKIAEANRGQKRSPETCALISKIMTGRIVSAETRFKMSLAKLGKPGSPSHMRGKKHPEATKQKISQSLRRTNEINRNNPSFIKKKSVGFRGPHTEVSKKKMSEALKGLVRAPFSEEHKRNLSIAKTGPNNYMFGKPMSEERKAVFNFTGRKHTAETLAKMSEVKIGEKHPLFGTHLSEEAKQHLSKLNSGKNHPQFGKKKSPESIQKAIDTRAKNKVIKLQNQLEVQNNELCFGK